MKMRLTFLLVLLLTAGYIHAQNTVTLRFVESMMKKLSFIQVVYDDGRSESIELESWGGAMTTPASASKAMKENQAALVAMMRRLETEGYALTHMSSSGESGLMNTLMIFKR